MPAASLQSARLVVIVVPHAGYEATTHLGSLKTAVWPVASLVPMVTYGGLEMVAGERRSEPRQALSQQRAWVVDDIDPTPVAVVVANISKSGANLLASAEVPKEFALYLTPDGRVQRRCRVIWRDGDSIGVSIIPDRGGARQPASEPSSFLID